MNEAKVTMQYACLVASFALVVIGNFATFETEIESLTYVIYMLFPPLIAIAIGLLPDKDSS